MKTSKIAIVSIVALTLVVGLSNMALARTNVSVGIGVGNPGFYPGGYGYYGGFYGASWGGRHHHFRGSNVFIGGSWGWPGYYPGYYDYPGYNYYPYQGYYDPGYYVAEPPPPPAAERPVVFQQTQPMQQGGYTESLYGPIGAKKRELLNVLMTGDKEHRINAINELAGYSYDDNVRLALEKVLFSDTDPELRVAAANAFGTVRNLKAIPALEKARVEDSVTDVRRAADLSIKKLQGN
jgi:hypothetical protein